MLTRLAVQGNKRINIVEGQALTHLTSELKLSLHFLVRYCEQCSHS
jgi:hypothetical protein